ncbi:hypothetical protein H4683_001340 [Filibacter limicola]|uniref:Uncharacterized protein n=1 Tax=Sporosarcina limicola TaxID=34101 RepID=A0A927RCD9_9BACL|nr:hypothetical protein [Sporosarcina limicola]
MIGGGYRFFLLQLYTLRGGHDRLGGASQPRSADFLAWD